MNCWRHFFAANDPFRGGNTGGNCRWPPLIPRAVSTVCFLLRTSQQLVNIISSNSIVSSHLASSTHDDTHLVVYTQQQLNSSAQQWRQSFSAWSHHTKELSLANVRFASSALGCTRYLHYWHHKDFICITGITYMQVYILCIGAWLKYLFWSTSCSSYSHNCIILLYIQH